ncbi:MAG: class I SAM-dependent methyltransferase [Desulfobacteraceae bacterium]|jgi:ubiquinone/menaquinone biosynthesis C-methylase UbiE
MDLKEYDIMYRAEESHWWYQGMARITRKIVENYYHPGGGLRILDAGCGTGAGMILLSDYGMVTGLDLSPYAIRFCLKRGTRRIARASVMALPFPDQSFDLVTSFDILYFEKISDEIALHEYARVLIPGGRIILRVPAFDWLRGVHDEKVSTGHRYTLEELSGKIAHSGLQPEFINYVNSILFPLVVLKRLSEKWLPMQTDSDIAVNMGLLGLIFKYCLILESHLVKRYRFPFGVSLVAVGRKPST